VTFLIAMVGAGKPVAAIGHGPCTLIEGGLVAGRTVTSSPSLQTDLRNAGAVWVDDALRICRDGDDGDGVMITGRRTADLPAFCRAITDVFAETRLTVTRR
jgi:protease I